MTLFTRTLFAKSSRDRKRAALVARDAESAFAAGVGPDVAAADAALVVPAPQCVRTADAADGYVLRKPKGESGAFVQEAHGPQGQGHEHEHQQQHHQHH